VPDEWVGRPMEILLIEDNQGDARLTMEALKEGDVKHRLTLALNGEEAMQFLRREKWFARAPHPDLILLDLNLPGKDGREVLREVKEDLDLKNIPVVILTSSRHDEDILRSQGLNVEGYMTKPVNLEKFVGLVKQLQAYWQADVILPTTD
jgi:chemotaxis family two-component system response regulator Rcp1